MAVIALRKDRLQVVRYNSYLDENGNWHSGQKTYGNAVPCDAVPGGAAAQISLEDGTLKRYSYTVYMDHDCPEFSTDDLVILTRNNGETRQAPVLGFHRYQHQAMLWI